LGNVENVRSLEEVHDDSRELVVEDDAVSQDEDQIETSPIRSILPQIS